MEREENKMGVMPVKRLIVTMSLPIMASMLVQALYNVVDSIFVAQINENAVTALSIAFPLQTMIISVAGGTGVGINALLSRSLGEKNFAQADRAASSGIFLAMASFLVFLFIGIFGTAPFVRGQLSSLDASASAESVAQIQRFGEQYLGIVLTFSLGSFFQVTNERLLQATGRTFYSMITQATGAIINIIFDPIMIFGLLGFPRLEVAGAAYATVLGQFVAAGLGIFFNVRYNKDITIRMAQVFRPHVPTIVRIYAVAVPSILMMSIGSVMTYLMNRILLAFSTTADAVFGIYFKLQSFFFMPVFGLNNGVIPILAYNYGARKKERIAEALRFSLLLAVSIMLVGMLVLLLAPRLLFGFFNASDEMLAIGVPALRIISIHFPIAGACIAMGAIFQAFSQSQYSLIISVARQLGVLIPVAWLLARMGHLSYVWWAFPIAEALSLVLSLIFFRRLYRQTVQTL